MLLYIDVSHSLDWESMFSVLWKILLFFFVLANLKNFPLVWHIRQLNAFRFILRSNHSNVEPSPALLFQPIITSSRNPLMELDYNIHKSNSTYFSDLDVCRSHLLCTLFAKGVEQARYNNSSIGSGNERFTIMLGAVSCHFRREIKPYQRYEMWTRLLAWDRKWIYMVTHFVKKDAVKPRAYSLYPFQNTKQNGTSKVDKKEDAIFASALSKCVFKKGRLTIAPEVMLEASGLLPERLENKFLHTSAEHHDPPQLQSLFEETANLPFKAMAGIGAMRERMAENLLTTEDDMAETGPQLTNLEEWTWERVEQERCRGLQIANLLHGLDSLVHEFSGEGEALGKHY